MLALSNAVDLINQLSEQGVFYLGRSSYVPFVQPQRYRRNHGRNFERRAQRDEQCEDLRRVALEK